MLSIVRRGAATREKPPEVVRGQASRLPWAWDGLCFGVPFNDSTTEGARDLVTNQAPTVVGSVSWVRDNRGNPAALLDTTAYIEYADTPTQRRPTTAITAYVRLRRNGTPENDGGIFVKPYGSSDPYMSWGLYASGSNINAIASRLTTNGPTPFYMENNDYPLTTTEWISVFLRWRTGLGDNIIIVSERGQILSSLTNISAATGTIAYVVGQPLRINFTSDGWVEHGNHAYSQVMVWDRMLSDVEVQALVADPYGWYSPRRETVGLSSPYPLIAPQSFMREVPSG